MSQNANTDTLTGDGTTASFSVAHGLRNTPVYAHVTALGTPAGNASPFKIASIDETNINFTCAVAPVAGSFQVMYLADDGV